MIKNKYDIVFHILMNEQLLWEFIELFANKFSLPVVDEFGTHRTIRSVQAYGPEDGHQGTVFADVKVGLEEADRFKSFLGDFARYHNQELQTV